jgi:hypothetical protein
MAAMALGSVRLFVAAGAVLAFFAGVSHAIEGQWPAPHLDTWFYHNAFSGVGTRWTGPTWTGGLTLNQAGNEFEPHSATSPSRHGMTLVAFDTSVQIEAGLPPQLYEIESLEVTMTMQSSTGALFYDDTPDTRSEILSDLSMTTMTRLGQWSYTGWGSAADTPAMSSLA